MPTTYALLSTCPPTQCGLATFTAALLTHMRQPGDQVAVVRVLDEPTPAPAGADEIVHARAYRELASLLTEARAGTPV